MYFNASGWSTQPQHVACIDENNKETITGCFTGQRISASCDVSLNYMGKKMG